LHGETACVLIRTAFATEVDARLREVPVVALVGPRQCGKKTLARSIVDPQSANYFDLESPRSLARLDEPLTALEALHGTIVIDEVRRRPELFPILRVLADERPITRRILVLVSASPALLQQSSESLAGRVRVIEMTPFTVDEIRRAPNTDSPSAVYTRWLLGGFPRSYLATDDTAAFERLNDFLRSIIERDLSEYGLRMPWAGRRRLVTMLVHYHGQTADLSAMGSALRISRETVRRYVNLMTDLFHVRQLRPWFENIGKRQVKSPRLYFRDTGVLHPLLGIGSRDDLLLHPRLGASWEGLVIEEILTRTPHREAYWWSTQNGAELDLLLMHGTKRFGVEVKHADAPRMTKSIGIAMQDLSLERVTVVAPVRIAYDIADRVRVVPFEDVVDDPDSVVRALSRMSSRIWRDSALGQNTRRGSWGRVVALRASSCDSAPAKAPPVETRGALDTEQIHGALRDACRIDRLTDSRPRRQARSPDRRRRWCHRCRDRLTPLRPKAPRSIARSAPPTLPSPLRSGRRAAKSGQWAHPLERPRQKRIDLSGRVMHDTHVRVGCMDDALECVWPLGLTVAR